MVYSIFLKRKKFGIFNTITKIENVKYHAFPNDFQNHQYLLVVKIDESREMINLSNYDSVDFPAVAFANFQQNSTTVPQETTDLDNLTPGQRKQLNNKL
jgi:hypothetical protein